MLQLLQQLDRHATDKSDAVAVRELDPDSRSPHLTWRQLREAVHALAQRLRQRGPAGQVGILCQPNTCEFWVSFLAMLAADMIAFPFAPDAASAELAAAAQRTGAKFILGQVPSPPDSSEARVSVSAPANSGRASPGTAPPHAALLLQSSGTTAQPKIVYRSGRSLDSVSAAMCNAIGACSDDRILATVPLCHSYGIEHGLLVPLWAGCEVRLMRSLDMRLMLEQLQHGGVTLLPSVPVAYDMLWQLADIGPRFPSLRAAYSAGAPLPIETYQHMLDRCGVRVSQLYGATEIGSVTYNHPQTEPFDPRSVGRAMNGVELRILNPDSAGVPAPPGVQGPLLVRAASMMDRYWDGDDPGVVNGFWDTGDLATIDAAGALTITGRAKLLIDVGGRKVNPLEVEQVLRRHPAVADVCVVRIRLTPTLSRLRAVVCPRPPHTPAIDDLRHHCRRWLAPHKVPRVFEFRDSLPRNGQGKIERRLLEEP